jgi:hypothetical protein
MGQIDRLDSELKLPGFDLQAIFCRRRIERSRRANWKHGHFSREAKAEQSRLRAALLALRDLCNSI